MTTLMDTALEHASRGWRVHPLRPKSKLPILKGWQDKATTNPETIREWWTKHPTANIAIACGKGSDLFVLDLDDEEVWERFEAAGKHVPTETTIVKTPRGYHIYFQFKEGLRNTVRVNKDNADVRGEGGYVVAAGSEVGGKSYEFVSEGKVIVPPEWLTEPPPPPAPSQTPYTASLAPRETVGYRNVDSCVKILQERVDALSKAPAGTRNDTLNKAALMLGHYVGAGRIDGSYVENELLNAALSAGLDERESRATIQSGLGAGVNEPRIREVRWKTTAQVQEAQMLGEFDLVCLEDVKERPLNFFWNHRIPVGKLTLLAGYAKLGKSFLTLSIAASVTAGIPLPNMEGQTLRGECLFISYEDDPADTIKPRARSLGVDLSKFYCMNGVKIPTGRTRQFGAQDADQLSKLMVARPEIKLVVIDPFGSYVGSTVDVNRENETRAALQPLTEAAQETGAAIVVVCHFKKGDASSGPALHRVSGSQGITAISRSVLTVDRVIEKDPFTGEDRVVPTLQHTAANLSAAAPDLTYKFDGGRFEWD